MTRKNTVWGARHVLEDKEIKRIINYYKKEFGISLTKLEASAIQSIRSKEIFWSEKKAKEVLIELRKII